MNRFQQLGIIFSETTRLSLRQYQLAPEGLYWGPSGNMDEQFEQLLIEIGKLRYKYNSLNLKWNFRYDAEKYFNKTINYLGRKDINVHNAYTHVLTIGGDTFETVSKSKFKPVTRRQIRIGQESGLVIREIKTPQEIDQYDYVSKSWADVKGIPQKSSLLVSQLSDRLGLSTLFLGAYLKDQLLAVIFLFRDQLEWFYWHGIRDFQNDKYFATDVLLAYAIQQACENNITYFNMGGSNNILSLEFFKERWGAQKFSRWRLEWKNPFWSNVLKLTKRIKP